MVNIIEIQNGVVYNNILFAGENAIETAEIAFAGMVREHGYVGDDSMEGFLDDGYCQFRDWTICISHPTIRK